MLAFDFDGTIHWPEHESGVDARLFEWIEFLRKKYGLVWGVCTGRSLPHLMEGLAEVRAPFGPDFVVAREREILLPGSVGRYEADKAWSKRMEKDHRRLFRRIRKDLAMVKAFVEGELGGEWVETPGDPAGVVLREAADMEALLEEVEKRCHRHAELSYERNGIYLRFSHADYGKGPALMELARRWSLEPHQVVAAGDNFNDLSMLSPEVTKYPVCPGNAVGPVKKRVAVCGGHVGESPASIGVVETFERIFLPAEAEEERELEEEQEQQRRVS
ncbi:MAG: HAD-IIB family hydrolase [Verrucomicrobiota bacterium]